MSQSPLGDSENPPTLVLTPLQESHPFQERRIVLSDVIKVGRSVARFKPAPNNAIFDCKVLSRSHALLWYQAGKFWLRDTNSSNGTFVNNTRVQKKANEEFSDREIFSGDIIRFGVDVVERDTTHGCIIAEVTLYFGNGCEAKPNLDQTGVINGVVGTNAFYSEQVFRLFHLASEALYREQSLVEKLDELKNVVSSIGEISKRNRQVMLREDHLLQKLELYESQLSMLKEDLPPDSLQRQLCQALEDKTNIEKASQITLARIMDEKVEAMAKVEDLKCSLSDSERECARLREVCANDEEAYQTIAGELRTKIQELDQLEEQLKTVTTEKENLESELKKRFKEVEVSQDVMSNMKPNMKNKFTKVPSLNADELNNKVDLREQLHSSMGRFVASVIHGIRTAEQNESDRLCEMQEISESSGANSEQILDSTTDCISIHLSNGLRQVNQSTQLIKSLQDELSILARLNCTLMREAKDSGSASSAVVCDTSVPVSDTESDRPNESNDLSFPLERNVTTEKCFSAVLDRARQLVIRLISSQALAEVDLNRYCAQCSVSRVCHALDGETKDFDTTAEVENEPQVQCSTASAPTVDPPCTTSRGVEAESSVDEDEVIHLRQELTQLVAERDVFKQKALEYQEQDSSKSELLLSVREECNALRSRIAQIESEVVTSREDHQRLVSEARRSRTEAEELRQERDCLAQEVATCQRQMEQMRIALAETLIRPKNPAPQLNNPVDSDGVDSAVEVSSPSNTVQHATMSNERSTYSIFGRSECVANIMPSPMGMTRLFAIIPTMILLCAVMVFIFSKFVG